MYKLILFFCIYLSLFFYISCIPSIKEENHRNLQLPKNFNEEEVDEKTKNLAEEVWTKFFNDPHQINLIQTAMANNQELAKLEQEIQIANNEILARQGEYLPKLGLVADSGIEKVERFSTENANSPTLFTKGGVMMTWEIDIWKKLRNSTKAAYLRYLASVEGRRFVVTNLISEISNTYYEMNSLHTQMQLIDDYIKVLTRINEIVSLLQQAGRTNKLAVQRFNAEVSKNQAKKFQLQQNLSIAENRMNALLGRFPQSINYQLEDFLNLDLPEIQTSVPVKLLENRPDLRQASLELQASKLDVDVARARFYPSLSIDGNLGYEAFNSKHFDGTQVGVAYALAGGITMPLLNRRGIEASYRTANNMQIQALYNYEQTLIESFTEVSNQIIKLKNLKYIYDLKSQQVDTLKKGTETADALFRAGRTDYVDVLLTQRDFIEAQIELVEIKNEQLQSSIGLYKAIGGGWRGQN
ncbi:TolC family protein [Leptospira sp. GIMC2001]|uniref:TolC family protein n=1 Tax=Leptospira sp. GIMC2001 TaxID=1513297 RepID=UPI002349691D|nr:TolC family protein [Leptospira sp. GIMC2001]WCL50253.1 TolC family protein [Leptospira sp. GIMC2001]